MKQALILVDVQESFRRRPYFRDEELPRFLRNVQSLINRCQSRDIALLQVFHEELSGDAANPFAAASGCVRAMPELALRADAVFYKQVHSALFGRTDDGVTLEAWLREHGIGELLVTGIRTEQCCETTTRHASDLGFAVRYVSDATLTSRCVPAADARCRRRRSASTPSSCSTGALRRWCRPRGRWREDRASRAAVSA